MPSKRETTIAKIDFLSINYTSKVTKLRDNLFIIIERLLKDDDEYKAKLISNSKDVDDNRTIR